MAKALMCEPELLAKDLAGKTYLVTGGNSGVGLATTRQLAAQGARVVIGCRKVAEGESVARELRAEGVRGTVLVRELDLANLESVRGFAKGVMTEFDRLDGLVNNAGVMNTPFGRTKDGFESQIGVNHLGHFLLTEELLPLLQKSAPSRIVNVSSSYHVRAFGRDGRIDFDDLNYEKRKYDGWEAYAQSKLANVLYAKDLAERLRGTGVVAVSVHPGWVRTRLMRHSIPLWVQNYLLRPFLRLGGMIEPFEGAQSSLFALLSPRVSELSGAFFSQTGLYPERALRKGGWPLRSPSPFVHDATSARRLTELSRTLVFA